MKQAIPILIGLIALVTINTAEARIIRVINDLPQDTGVHISYQNDWGVCDASHFSVKSGDSRDINVGGCWARKIWIDSGQYRDISKSGGGSLRTYVIKRNNEGHIIIDRIEE